MHEVDRFVHVGCFLSMGWLNFVTTLTLLEDILVMVVKLGNHVIRNEGDKALSAVFPLGLPVMPPQREFLIQGLATNCWLLGTLKEVDVEIPGLHPSLHLLRIVQISDLHVGTTIRQNYVERVVA